MYYACMYYACMYEYVNVIGIEKKESITLYRRKDAETQKQNTCQTPDKTRTFVIIQHSR